MVVVAHSKGIDAAAEQAARQAAPSANSIASTSYLAEVPRAYDADAIYLDRPEMAEAVSVMLSNSENLKSAQESFAVNVRNAADGWTGYAGGAFAETMEILAEWLSDIDVGLVGLGQRLRNADESLAEADAQASQRQ